MREKEVGEAMSEGRPRKQWSFWRKWCHHGFSFWCKKYFWEGQLKHGVTDKDCEDVEATAGPFSNMSSKKRKLLGFMIPAVFFHFWYWSIMAYKNLFYVFADKYPMAITMVFGSVISGMTSVGGGAVAFPVMTLVMREPPEVARDLSMSIQANGMTAAAFSILFMKVHIERSALMYSFLGALAGVIFGLEVVDPVLTPSMKKMGFVSIFFAFAFTLFLINWNHKRKTYNNIPDLTWWKRLTISIFGFIGGIFTAFSGSGADICMFSLLTLYFKVSEKVATPTSVVLMAATSMAGWWWRAFVAAGMPRESWDYLLALVPIVTVGAPLGALVGTHFHRLVLAALVYILNTASLISAFVIVPQTAALAGGSVAAMVGMFVVYAIMYKLGERLNARYEETVVEKRRIVEIRVDKSNGRVHTNGHKSQHLDGTDNPTYHNSEENDTKL